MTASLRSPGRPPAAPDLARLGDEMHALLVRLFPLCRSLTGDGVRETLRILGEDLPLAVAEVPTGTVINDWTVPREWNLRSAWIADADGARVVNAARSSLHVVSYSAPVRARMSLDELRPHLHTLPDRPRLVPYRTSYWHETWGFCLAHETLEGMADGEYEVVIDSTLEDGSLTYAEAVLPGRSDGEAIVVTHVCHPSLANDNLSGVVVAAALARLLAGRELRHTWRFLFCPATVGSIAWLARNPALLPRLRHGLACVSVGDPGPLTYKPSRRGDAEVDRAALHVLRNRPGEHREIPYVPWGCDERQFTSPGYDVPMGALMRTPPGSYPENHTSADDPGFVRPEHLADSLGAYLEVVNVLERNRTLVSLAPYGEPQLGRRGLFRTSGGAGMGGGADERALMWVLNQADGRTSLLDVADRAALPFASIEEAAAQLEEAGLVRPAPAEGGRG